jgi:hypothetical protein
VFRPDLYTLNRAVRVTHQLQQNKDFLQSIPSDTFLSCFPQQLFFNQHGEILLVVSIVIIQKNRLRNNFYGRTCGNRNDGVYVSFRPNEGDVG